MEYFVGSVDFAELPPDEAEPPVDVPAEEPELGVLASGVAASVVPASGAVASGVADGSTVEPPEEPPVAELPPPDVLADAGVFFAVSTIASPYLPMASTEETQTAITQITAVTDLMMVSFMFL